MNDQGTNNLLWADSLMDGLSAAGVTRAVISPGSRSTPLVLAADRHPKIRTWTMVDERCAAFFALGLAKYDQSPVAVIATSGSAPANWYPAVIEANHSGTPLILLSADRPPELQNCGANQTINQTHLFNRQVRLFLDPGPATATPDGLKQIRELGIEAVHQALGQNPGPVHINLPFREPLVPEKIAEPSYRDQSFPAPVQQQQADTEQIGRITDIINQGPGIIICGPSNQEDGFAQAVTELARRLHLPILADPLSNLRFGTHGHSNIITHYDGFLRQQRFFDQNQPAWVLRFGAMPVAKPLMHYLKQSAPNTILCAPRGDWPDPLHQTKEIVRTSPTDLCNKLMESDLQPATDAWLKQFQQANQLTSSIQLTNESNQPSEDLIINELIHAIPDGSILFSGNSLPIRHLDSWSGSATKNIRIVANRGASGIDGNISTLLGMRAAGSQKVFGLLGDLAFYHDMNGLLAARDLDAVIVLLNNGGGGIFGHLPQAQLEQFESHWLTPTDLDFSKAAELYGVNFHRVTKQSEFAPALDTARDESGLTLIEVIIDRKQAMTRYRAWLNAVSDHSV
jgi:2-succinyl-5-enolpyruvyl-6-hydroxy-3-cyclohexene-1-carboxylate synthase